MEKNNEKIVQKVLVDHKLKRIYQEFSGYQELNEAERNLFDQIFPVLWFVGEMSDSNVSIASRTGYAVSTIEKRLRAIENHGHLIYRKIWRDNNPNTKTWTTKRSIVLDSFIKAEIIKELEKLKSGVERVSIKEKTVEAKEEQAKIIEEPPAQLPIKKKKVHFRWE